MAQYIDKDALVAEIERRIKINKECMLGLKNLDYYQGKVDALNDALSLLDTIEVKEVKEEPVSKDLEEAAEKYTTKVLERTNCLIGNQPVGEEVGSAFKAGAQWKEGQMMNAAKQSDVVITSGGILLSDLKIEDFDYEDKVKVLIIKHE